MEEAAAIDEHTSAGNPIARGRWLWLACIGVLIALGALLRFWQLSAQSLWFDEGYSAWVVSLAPARIVEVIQHDVSPPLYYLVLKLWVQVWGDSEAAMRSLSAAAAVVSLLLMPLMAWRITRDRWATGAAMALFAVSVLQIQYAQEARSYGLAAMFAAIALYATIRRMQGRVAWAAVVWAACAAGVYLHNMMWFYVAATCFAYLMLPGRVGLARRLVELSVVNVGLLAAYAWWVPALLGQIAWLRGNFWAHVPTHEALGTVLVAASGMKLMHLGFLGGNAAWLAAVVLLGLGIAALLGRTRDAVRYAAALVGFGLLPVLAVYLHAKGGQSYFVEKVFTASTLAMPLVVALALVGRARMLAAGLTLALLAGSAVSVWGQLYREPKEQWREASAYVNSLPRDGTLVVFVANEGELLYDHYTRRGGVPAHETTGAPQGFLDLEPPRTIQRVMQDDDTRRLERLLDERRPERVVLVYSHWHFSDPQERTKAMLEKRMAFHRIRGFHLVDVLEYGAVADER